MQLSNVKSVIVGVVAAAAVIAITGAASGSGIGAVFNLGKINKVNATSSLTGSTRQPMLSVTNSGSGPALSLQVGKGKAPLSVNSSVQVPNLNASRLGGLAASQFVQGGGQSRSFGFDMAATVATVPQELLSVPGFGTLNAACVNGNLAEVMITNVTHTVNRFAVGVSSSRPPGVNDVTLIPHMTTVLTAISSGAVWEQVILRYTTGSGGSLITHMATINIMAAINGTTCDFDASASVAGS